jgi:hypothetical protein
MEYPCDYTCVDSRESVKADKKTHEFLGDVK